MKKSIVGILTGSLLFIGTTFSVAADNHIDKDCADFGSQEEVMAFWYENGYSAENDPHRLDGDNDGLACEVSQSDYDTYVASQEADDSTESTTEEDKDENAVENENENENENESESEEEGAALPDTGSNGPLMMLFGAGIAGAGSLLLFRRKNKTA